MSRASELRPNGWAEAQNTNGPISSGNREAIMGAPTSSGE
jgi:hypothetical protein